MENSSFSFYHNNYTAVINLVSYLNMWRSGIVGGALSVKTGV